MANVNYDHPYITIQIFDNTEFVEENETTERKPFNGMQVGFFAGGRDNQLLYMLNSTQNLREFGDPNFKLYGQAGYNVDAALATKNCGMYVMNLKPETAKFANIVIMIRFKSEDVPEETTGEPGTGEPETVSYASGAAFFSADTATTLAEPTTGSGGIEQGEIGEGEVEWPDEGDDPTPPTTGGETGGDSGEGGGDTGDTGDTKPEEPVKKAQRLTYSFYAKYIEGAKTEQELVAAANNLMTVDPDENGFYNMPFMVIYTLGRGEFGNSIHINFANATEYITPDFFFVQGEPAPVRHIYTMTVMEPSKEGLSRRESSTGTFDVDGFISDGTENGVSLYIQDVINDVETGSQRVKSIVYDETMDAICALYNQMVEPGAAETPYTLDLLTNYKLDGSLNTNLNLDTTGSDYLNLFSLDGFTLKGGEDGWEGMTPEEIQTAKRELLIKAYAGDIDPYIKSRFSAPCDFNLDACYPVPVKRQMAALANNRKYDLMTYLDMGIAITQNALLNIAKTMRTIYGFNVIKEGNVYSFRDTKYTGKQCQVTMTHWLAKAIPNHHATEDTIYGATLARETAVLRAKNDYLRGSFLPVIEPDEDDYKETLYKLRVNIYETLTYNSVQRSTAITSCQTKSDRLLEMNEYILQKAVHICYDIMSSKLYKFGEEEDRSEYEQSANDILKFELKKYVRAVSVEFEMTPQDEKKSLLRLKLHMTFKTVIQKGEIDIYLDPRVTDDTSTTGITIAAA